MDRISLPAEAASNEFYESFRVGRFIFLIRCRPHQCWLVSAADSVVWTFQLHHGCRAPSHRCARPSAMSVSPIERPLRVTVLSLRPYRSSSLLPPTSENVPALSNSCRRYFAASPLARSAPQRGGLSSGASMSAILIFTRSSQNVSPSTTQVTRRSLPQIGNVAVSVSVRGAAIASFNRSIPKCSIASEAPTMTMTKTNTGAVLVGNRRWYLTGL